MMMMNLIIGDFNAKMGKRNRDEAFVGDFGIGIRNESGVKLAEFVAEYRLFTMNSFYKGKEKRKWT